MSDTSPTIEPPTEEQVRDLAANHHIDLTDEEVAEFAAAIPGVLASYEALGSLPDPEPERGAEYGDRDPGGPPTSETDPLNAVVTECRVEGAADGPLAGYDVGVKDNVSVAGVQMTCGSSLLEGYVPTEDATIVTRLLDAGATITCKTNMEDLAFSGSGELSATGPVLNPRSDRHIAGGSSSGSAAAVVAGDVDLTIGGDQGGSIRIPASWSGCVGHKPTHTLVPYTGIVGLGHSFDHAGPMAMSVEDCARALNVLAGKDPNDPRQGAVPTDDYLGSLSSDPEELTIGVLEEGFGLEESERAVDDTVRAATETLADAGAVVREVSVPMHEAGETIWNGVVVEETNALIHSEGVGHFGKGTVDRQFAEAFGRARRESADDYPPTLKLTLVLGQYLADEYRGRYYHKAKNLALELASAYDEALADVDVLAMPTTPQTAHDLDPDLSRMEYVERGLNMLTNTSPFDVTGHPAISVPAGTDDDDLPVGLMLVGERFDDATVLRAGQAAESHVSGGLL